MDNVEDLIEYTKEDEHTVKTKMHFGGLAVHRLWEQYVDKFYKKNTHYLYDLTEYNNSEGYKELLSRLTKLKGKKILDFGGGIGTICILLAENNTVHYADIVDSPVWKYAKWRFEKHNINVKMLDAKKYGEFDNDYDYILLIDVAEHLLRWREILYGLSKKSKEFIMNFPAQGYATCHLTRPDVIKEFISKFGEMKECSKDA